MRRFYLQRDEDATGISGTGKVAEGILFSTGWVARDVTSVGGRRSIMNPLPDRQVSRKSTTRCRSAPSRRTTSSPGRVERSATIRGR